MNNTVNTWAFNVEEQDAYLRAMASEHYDAFSEQAFSEKHYHYLKKKTLNEYLVPTLNDLFHLRELLKKKSGTSKIKVILKTAEAQDEWMRNDVGPSLAHVEDVAPNDLHAEFNVLAPQSVTAIFGWK
ncbi:hypothetical protein [Absidia glauca]|uniref:Uncharacterized protein n=1 Tax=Absidia glauca TaxID=4829 RepID=A0A168KT99_ABSGL|nr:hypothetical protein [Absidia glauca]